MSARMLVLMGSGETSPTMTKTHREVLAAVGSSGPAVLIDTPFGFQENATDITERALSYFKRSTGARVEVASFRSAEAGSFEKERFVTQVRQAGWIFSGPGSPTYALELWKNVGLGEVLGEKLVSGGAIVFSSAASLTLGSLSVPVYEIYKVGAPPAWREGLGVLAGIGLDVAVIPHYDNAEGGNHDTRYCYLGERRLAMMEAQMAPGQWILGIDEHTALVADLDSGEARVTGRSSVVVRVAGTERRLPAGSEFSLDDLVAWGNATAQPAGGRPGTGHSPHGSTEPEAVGTLEEALTKAAAEFDRAIECRQATIASKVVIELEEALRSWDADTEQSDAASRGRSLLRSMIIRLGQAAEMSSADPRNALGPIVTLALEMRDAAREDRRYGEADRIRDALTSAGVEIRDTPQGTEWHLDSGTASSAPQP